MSKTTTPKKTVPRKTAKAPPMPPAVDMDDENDGAEESGGGAFFEIQKPLIQLIEDYLLSHPVGGKKMTLKAFGEHSSLNVANLKAIVNGNRWAAKCSREIVKKLAIALEIPVLQVYLLAGFFSAEDVVYSTNIDETVEAIYRKMVKDKRVTFRCPSEVVWNTWPMSAKLSVCMFYEALTEKYLLRYAGS